MAGLSDISLGNFTRILYGQASVAAPTSVLGDVQSIGDITDEATIVDVPAYAQKYLKKLVGSANASAIEVVCNYDPSDAGQIDLFAAYNASAARMIRIEMGIDATFAGDATSHVTGIEFDCLVASASVSNSFDETRTVTFSLVPTDGLGDGYTAVTN